MNLSNEDFIDVKIYSNYGIDNKVIANKIFSDTASTELLSLEIILEKYGFFLNKKLVIPFKKYYGFLLKTDELWFKTGHLQFDIYTLDGEFICNIDL